MSKWEVFYFEKAGEQNTVYVIEAVKARVNRGDVTYIVIASNSGKTALKLLEALKNKDVKIICVTESPQRLDWKAQWPTITEKTRKQLKDLGVVVVENSPYASYCSVLDNNRWETPSPNTLVYMTFRTIGGAGLKVAMEVMFMACWAGVIPPGENVIAIGGTERGADTAIVVRSAFQENFFAKEASKRPMIREILAWPIEKQWQDEPF
ncbi:MAG: pyruvate kinase alpha/beta domain-containing protein [Candidatus Heimdallarchaeota archaeon]